MNEGVARLVDALSPGATPVGLRRLKGGLGNLMHVLRYEEASGQRRSVVLRRLVKTWSRPTPELARYEFAVLTLLAQTDVPAPRPLLLDTTGHYLGVPALALSYTPGRSFFRPRDEGVWTEGLATALVQVHGVTSQRFDLTSLRPLPVVQEQLDEDREHIADAGPLAQQAFETLEARIDAIAPVDPCLVHDDYWPGNTVWYRGRLAAVIDWPQAGVGDRRADVAQCRADLVVSHGIATADAFLRFYQHAAPEPLPDMWYFDLLRGLRALLHYPRWLKGYHDAGLRHLTLADVGGRLEAFVLRALDEAP